MKKYLMALVLALSSLLSGCLAMSLSTPLRGGTICLTPKFDAGGYSTQAVVSKYAQANIVHMQIDLYSGATLISSKDILNAALGNTVTISNLKSDTTYTIKASAYKAAGVAAADLISIPADSQVEVPVAFDDRPTLAGIPVKLIDTPFGGQATGSVVVTPSANFTTPATESFPFIISTFAGNGTEAYGGDNGAATSAKLDSPGGVDFDSDGNLYIADTHNHRIRKVNKATGIISAVAGIASYGYNGDGGLATAAQLKSPSGLAFDSDGNLYIADTLNHRIRKVNKADGIISTVAGDGTGSYGGDGGLATAAQLKGPRGVAFDSAGNLYIADTDNCRIRKVNKATGIISTVAGTGSWSYNGDGVAATSAKVNGPCGVAFDSAGNLYIADTGNSRIRKVNKDTQIISTVAGDGTEAYGGDGVAATSAKLQNPYKVTFDSADNLYIADTLNNRIRKVNKADGIISTVAGDGTSSYGGDGGDSTSAKVNGPCGVAFDSADNLYIADTLNCRIRKVCF